MKLQRSDNGSTRVTLNPPEVPRTGACWNSRCLASMLRPELSIAADKLPGYTYFTQSVDTLWLTRVRILGVAIGILSQR